MEVIDYKIIYIDIVNGVGSIAEFQETQNIDQYTLDLLQRARIQQDRRYKFNDNKRTTKDRILNIALNRSIGNIAIELGNDLACSEKNKNDEIKQLKTHIPMGILIVAYGLADNNEFILLLKSDYDKFISEATGAIQTGLSLKNQIYKTCLFQLLRGNNDVGFGEISTSESNKRQSEYWHKDFLELAPIYTDTQNTTVAYSMIKKQIIEPLKTKSISDYNTVKQMTVGYFRQEGVFDIDYYWDEIIGTYQPHDPKSIDINSLTSKIDNIKKSNKFDHVFNKDTSAVKDRIKGIHHLTDEMDLKVKSEISNPENVILPYDNNGRKGLTIISERGYSFAKDIHDNKN